MGGTDDTLIFHRWLRHAAARPGDEAIVHWCVTAQTRRWAWGDLARRAGGYARWLAAAGVRPGQVCALIVRHHPEFYPLYMGVTLAGAVPAVVAYPNPRVHPDKFRDGIEGMVRVSGLEWVLTEPDLADVLPARDGTTVRGILFPLDPGAGVADADPAPPAGIDPAGPCLLQHSSGTTGLQKGVMLSHRAVLGHIDTYSGVLGITPADRVASWLPLYHDMGFIAAFHQSLARGIPLVQLDPFEWVRAPAVLLEAIHRERATVCWLPNFAYNLTAERVHDDDLAGVRLDSVRLFVNCSEPVRAESHDRFLRRFEPYGLRPTALGTCYAMAETTFAVTQSATGVPPPAVVADRAELARGQYRPAAAADPTARRCVSSGRPIPGCAVKVVGSDGSTVPDGRVGELLIRSAAMFDGYRNQPGKTAEAFTDGWYRSGDLGFMLGGELYVIGRKKDIIIVAGKNLAPEDIEDAVGRVPGVLPGRVVAFGAERADTGTEEVHVIAETGVTDPAGQKALTLAVQRAGMGVDVTVSRVHLVPPRWLIKSTSGKISRSANRDRLAGLAAAA